MPFATLAAIPHINALDTAPADADKGWQPLRQYYLGVLPRTAKNYQLEHTLDKLTAEFAASYKEFSTTAAVSSTKAEDESF